MELIKIRLIQIRREAKLLGAIYSAAILALIVFAVYRVHLMYLNFNTAAAVALVTALSVLFVQLTRGDKPFVLSQMENPNVKIFAEYSFFLTPFVLPALFTPHFYFVPLVLAAVYAVTRVRYGFRRRTRLSALGKIIRPRNFEWLGGIRTYRIIFLSLYAAAAASSGIMVLPQIFLILVTLVIASFYRECEPLNILYETAKSPRKFLFGKIQRHVILLWAFFAPVLAVNSLVNPSFLIINAAFLFVQSTILVLGILFKYKIYEPCCKLPGNEIYLAVIQTLTVLPFVMGGIPFLLPLPFFLCLKYYFSASDNLKEYLNA